MGESKGNKWWQAVKDVNAFRWIFPWLAKFGWAKSAGVAVIPLVLTALLYIIHAPWPVIGFMVMVFIYFVVVLLLRFAEVRLDAANRLVEQVQVQAKKDLELKFTAHGDQSSHLTLEVTSSSDTAIFQAQIRLVSRSDNQAVDTSPFFGEWKYEVPVRYSSGNRRPKILREARLETGIGRLLEIAKWAREDDRATMEIIGKDAWIMWEHKPTPEIDLPFFTLNIEFFGEGLAGSVCKQYKVGPRHAYGPLGMTEVSA